MNVNILKNIIAGAFLSAQACGANVIYSDNFDSGKPSSLWTNLTSAVVVSLPSETGRSGFAMRFTYTGNADDTIDAFSEARFDLKAEYKNLTIKYDLFIPANYVHQKPSDRIDNNKFLRLWREQYTVGDHIGASMLSEPDGDSLLGVDYKIQPTWGISTGIDPKGDFITAADKGKWISIRIEVEAPKSSTLLGAIRIFKNNKLFVGTSKVTDVEPGEQGWRYGYLLGWANSGFRADTILYIDNVEIDDSAFERPKPPEDAIVR